MTKEWLNQVARHALGYKQSLEATYDICMSLLMRGIPGDFVECGVYAGAHCAVMAKAVLEFDESMKTRSGILVHMFDSFQGLPAADPRDQEIFGHHGAKVGESACSVEQVAANMRAWGIPSKVLRYHIGWFSDTVRGHGLSQIAFLRLDGDLYQSTKDCMPLEPLVVDGGWVCVDDFNLTGCREALFEKVVPAPVYWRKPTK